MRKATVILTALLLAAPIAARAKTGVEFQKTPETTKVGDVIPFTVMAYREPPAGEAGVNQELKPIVGRRPLVTFRSRSGAVLRIRATRTDLNGISYGRVRFTDKGPWSTALNLPGARIGPEMSSPISIGTGLVHTIGPWTHAAQQGGSQAAFPWVWILSLGAIGSALLVLVMRRRGRWGAA